MITWNDIVDLFELCAVFDQRTVSEEEVKAWLLVAQHSRWTKLAVQRAIVEHYAQGCDRPRITPAQITDTIRAARRQAATTFEAPRIPDELPTDYPTWYRQQLDAHIDRVIADWADGKPIPTSRPIEGAKPLIARTPSQRKALEQMREFTEENAIR